VVHDLVDAVEGIFLIDDGVQQDAESPYVLFFATVGTASEDFGGCVVCDTLEGEILLVGDRDGKEGTLTNGANKDIKRPALDVRCAAKVDELDIAFAI
jgi:hypothetical protein